MQMIMGTNLKVYFLNGSNLNAFLFLKTIKLISLICFFKFSFQSIAAVQYNGSSSGPVEVILLFLKLKI